MRACARVGALHWSAAAVIVQLPLCPHSALLPHSIKWLFPLCRPVTQWVSGFECVHCNYRVIKQFVDRAVNNLKKKPERSGLTVIYHCFRFSFWETWVVISSFFTCCFFVWLFTTQHTSFTWPLALC